MFIVRVIKANETYGPLRRYAIGDFVSGYEADRLLALGLAEYNGEEHQEDDSPEASDPIVDDKDIADETEKKAS